MIVNGITHDHTRICRPLSDQQPRGATRHCSLELPAGTSYGNGAQTVQTGNIYPSALIYCITISSWLTDMVNLLLQLLQMAVLVHRAISIFQALVDLECALVDGRQQPAPCPL